MTELPSPFKSQQGETEYMAAYEATMRLWPVQYESINIPSRFGSTHVVACGHPKARPLVLLHCFSASLTIWANNISDLSRHYRIYAADMMGQPSKSIPDQPIRNREEMVEWLSCVVDALGLLQFDLVGYSYGGGAALNYAIHARDRIDRLILLSPVGGIARPRMQFYVRGMLTVMPGLAAPAMRSFFNWMFYRPNLKKDDVRPLAACVLRQMVLGARHFRMGTIVPPSQFPDEELRSVAAPTLLLIGEQEALYDPVAATERAKRLIPKITSRLIPEAGHDLPVGQHETVNKLVLQYLERDARIEVEVTAW